MSTPTPDFSAIKKLKSECDEETLLEPACLNVNIFAVCFILEAAEFTILNTTDPKALDFYYGMARALTGLSSKILKEGETLRLLRARLATIEKHLEAQDFTPETTLLRLKDMKAAEA